MVSSIVIYQSQFDIKYIRHQLFVHTQLSGKTVLFLTIQFNISHLFAHSLDDKQFYLTPGPKPIRIREDLGATAMRGTQLSPKAPEQKRLQSDSLLSYQKTRLKWALPLWRDAICVFYGHRRLGCSLKVNVIARLEFELAYNNVAIQYVSQYATRTSCEINVDEWNMLQFLDRKGNILL